MDSKILIKFFALKLGAYCNVSSYRELHWKYSLKSHCICLAGTHGQPCIVLESWREIKTTVEGGMAGRFLLLGLFF